ncbi:unnamed protein product, partial [Polarella glacialis]
MADEAATAEDAEAPDYAADAPGGGGSSSSEDEDGPPLDPYWASMLNISAVAAPLPPPKAPKPGEAQAKGKGSGGKGGKGGGKGKKGAKGGAAPRSQANDIGDFVAWAKETRPLKTAAAASGRAHLGGSETQQGWRVSCHGLERTLPPKMSQRRIIRTMPVVLAASWPGRLLERLALLQFFDGRSVGRWDFWVLLTAAKKSTGGMADDGFNVLYVVTFLAGGLVAIVCAAAVYAVRVLQRRAAAKNQVVAATDSGASKAWPDPEKGEVQHAKEEMKDVHITKKVESLTGEAPLTSQQLTQQLCDTLSSLLDEHISQKGKGIGLQAEGELLERMARLERQLAEVQGVREFRYPVGLRGAACGSLEEDTDGRGLKDTLRSSIADTQTPNSSDHSSASYMEDDLPGAVASVVVPPLPPLPPLQEEAVPPQ